MDLPCQLNVHTYCILYLVGTWFYEHPYCTDSDIVSLFRTNALLASRFGLKCLLNTLYVNVNILHYIAHMESG